jgi:hypothetical protein
MNGAGNTRGVLMLIFESDLRQVDMMYLLCLGFIIPLICDHYDGIASSRIKVDDFENPYTCGS